MQLEFAPLLVIDELGLRDRVSDFHLETVETAIDIRTRSSRPLLVCSNLDLSVIGKMYDDRVFSRLAAGTVVELVGKDRRIE